MEGKQIPIQDPVAFNRLLNDFYLTPQGQILAQSRDLIIIDKKLKYF